MPDTFKLEWDKTGEHYYETGLDRGVLFKYNKTNKAYGAGVAWNGLTSVEESPSGAEANKFYADNRVYLNLTSAEEYGATINAYTFPEEFNSCNGYQELAPGAVIGQQGRDTFAFSYRTKKGSDVDEDLGYIIHLVYGCKAAPSSKSHSTVNDSPEPIEMSWEITTTPIDVSGFKPTATVDIDSTTTDATKLAAFEKILYGFETTDARIPLPDEIVTLLGTKTSGGGATGGGATGGSGSGNGALG